MQKQRINQYQERNIRGERHRDLEKKSLYGLGAYMNITAEDL